MRKLMYFTLGFAAACGLCAYFLPGALLYLTAGAAALTLLCATVASRWKALKRVTLVLLGCAVGIGWYSFFHSRYLEPAIALDGRTETVTLRTVDYSFDTDYGSCVDAFMTLEGKTYQVRAYLNGKQLLEPGLDITGDFRFRITTPEGQKEETYHRGQGIFLLAYEKDALTVAPSRTSGWRDTPARLRRNIGKLLEQSFAADVLPFAKGLLLGDTTDFDYETETVFAVSGIRHVVAVSGLHISILFALISTVSFRRRYLTVLLGLPTVFAFAAVAGFTPSVTRACIMSALMLLATLFDREYDSATALSFASLMMLVSNPLVITSVGFQLSVSSVAGIYLFQSPLRQGILTRISHPKGRGINARLFRWLTASVSVTLSAMSLTMPLCAWYFGTVSLVGVLTNLLTLWVISFIFYGLIAVCLTGLFWQSGGVLLAKIIAWPIRYVLFVARTVAEVPLSAVYTRSGFIVAWLVLLYVLLVVFLVCRKKKPLYFACAAVISLCLSLLASWAAPRQDEVRVTVLDVGQGQCILLQSEGKHYLVDCGGDRDTDTADIAAETLLSQGITRLDGIVLTHLDRDHAGGAVYLMSRVDTDLLILPPEETDIALATSGNVVYATRDLTLSFGSSALRIYTPRYPGNGNEKSLCVLFDTEKCDILITGDRNGFGERSLLRYAAIPKVDILVAGHHGAASSTCAELLEAVRPETVLISVGENNSYGHPSDELLSRLSDFGCTVYRTDKDGTILIRR